jgi:hypothetical protein
MPPWARSSSATAWSGGLCGNISERKGLRQPGPSPGSDTPPSSAPDASLEARLGDEIKAAMDEPRFHQLRGPLSFDYPVE